MDEQESHQGHHERAAEAPESPERRSGVDRRQGGGPSRSTFVVGIVIVVLAIASVTVTAVSAAHQASFNACQRTYNTRTLEALAARAQAASQDRQAITDLIKATAQIQVAAKGVPLNDQSATDALRVRSAVALQNYLETIDQADRIRARHPVPEAPKCSLEQPNVTG